MQLIQIIYVSSATRHLSEDELLLILESSVRHNQSHNVTGMLLYAEGCFMQVLEGETAPVDETMGRIRQDSRHHTLLELTRSRVKSRDFANWSMGFRVLTHQDASAHPHFAPLFQYGFDAETLGNHPGLALDLLKEFANQEQQR